ncbi:MAG: 3'-5' exonuclease [Alphaproteobacteria bacterium]|nr:MAG: 3'-5' exonuclease [Alphaproteobacteria bacterium]
MAVTDLANELETMAAQLEQSGEYRVLRRLARRPDLEPARHDVLRQGLFVDVETTGLDPVNDEIIELAMVPFTYTQDGRLLSTGEAFQSFREPGKPIPTEVTALTGISDAMVAGASILPEDVTSFVAPASFVVAHNASFDRRFLERFCDVFTTKAWGCSMSQVDWAASGFEGVKLAYLAGAAGFFYDRHRAVHDCYAAIELLARVHAGAEQPALAQLLEHARMPTWRIWAENSPFDFKDLLKGRGYRWNGEPVSGPRSWYIDVPEGHREAELAFLKAEIYQGDVNLITRRISAYDRFSDRCA